MREDMDKVIVERPRLDNRSMKRHNRNEARVKNDLENAPTKEPLRPKTERTKSFNEHLQPLKRFLLKNVGRPWDKVKSEIHKVIGGRGTVQKHVLDHVKEYVTVDVVLIDKIPYHAHGTHARAYSGQLASIASEYNKGPQLYVCPNSGLLKIAKAPKKVAKTLPEVKRIDGSSAAIFLKGCWHLAKLKDFGRDWAPTFMFMGTVYLSSPTLYREDAVLGTVREEQLKALWGNSPKGLAQYAISLRPMKHAEIRQLP